MPKVTALAACDVLIMTAAVSDFRPSIQHTRKEKKDSAALHLELQRTTDILTTMTARKAHQTVVGFAAETHDVEAYARRKLERKGCDWMVANQVGQVGLGFAADTNQVTLLGADGRALQIGPSSKAAIAAQIIDLVAPTVSGAS